jgi:hypothetical protein
MICIDAPSLICVPLPVAEIGFAVEVRPMRRWNDTFKRTVIQHFGPHSRHKVIEKFNEVAKEHRIDSPRVQRFVLNDRRNRWRLRVKRGLRNGETAYQSGCGKSTGKNSGLSLNSHGIRQRVPQAQA